MDINNVDKNNKNFPVSFEVTQERVKDLLVNAIETAIYYWCQRVDCDFESDSDGLNMYNDLDNDAWALVVTSDDGEKTRINKDSISKGLKLMAQEYPQHFLDAVTENDDAITADVFFQCIVFNDVIYG
tara:strand:- start:111 stop:494 length:384 start_codon:yes stop_codon:yes gene_type:complete